MIEKRFKKESKLKEKYQNRIVELLGGELGKNQSINDAVRERIKLLEATAKTDYYTQKRISSQDELNQIIGKYGCLKRQCREATICWIMTEGL